MEEDGTLYRLERRLFPDGSEEIERVELDPSDGESTCLEHNVGRAPTSVRFPPAAPARPATAAGPCTPSLTARGTEFSRVLGLQLERREHRVLLCPEWYQAADLRHPGLHAERVHPHLRQRVRHLTHLRVVRRAAPQGCAARPRVGRDGGWVLTPVPGARDRGRSHCVRDPPAPRPRHGLHHHRHEPYLFWGPEPRDLPRGIRGAQPQPVGSAGIVLTFCGHP